MRTGIKTLAVGLIAAMAMSLANKAWAATSESMTLKVTVSVALSVALSDTEYNFGTIGANTVTVSTRAITITNDSGGRTEDYTIDGSTYVATGGVDWNINGDLLTSGVNIYSLCAQIGETQPAADGSTFDATDCFDAVTAVENMSASLFNGSGAPTDGNDVANADTRKLWFYFNSPTEITTGSGVEQSLTVTVTANDASTF